MPSYRMNPSQIHTHTRTHTQKSIKLLLSLHPGHTKKEVLGGLTGRVATVDKLGQNKII